MRLPSPCFRWGLWLLITALSGCAPLGRLSPLRPLERSLVFQPAKYPVGEWSPNLEIEEAQFESADGTKLHGWYLDHPEPQGVALFCHGNGGNVTLLADTLQLLRDRHQLSVMTFDYRGYGRSAGSPSEAGIMQDGRAARKWLSQRTGTPESDIILMGQSLGGAVAIDLAASDGARGLVLVSTFTSLPDVGASHAPWLLPHLNMTMRMDSLSKLPKYRGPVLITHGDADEVVPFEQGQALFEAATGRKHFVREAGGHHNDSRTEEHRIVFDQFINSLKTRTN